MKKFIEKVISYINARYISKHIDNKYWKLTDRSGKISVQEHTTFFDQIVNYYPAFEADITKNKDPRIHHFVTQIFSRYVYKIEDAIIDPVFGWVILNKQELFRYSWPLIEDPWDAIKTRPSVIGCSLKGRIATIENGIWIKFAWSNYYHFFLDTLPQIYACDMLEIPADIPILVPVSYNNMKFVQDYLALLPLKRKVIVLEKGKYTKVKELFIVKDRLLSENMKQIVQDVHEAIDKQHKNQQTFPLIFVSRNKKHKRTLRNLDAIEAIARSKGFEIIEPGNYTWEQQINLFSNAKRIVGIHGAGLTNIIFCKDPTVKILELFPGNGLNPEHYGNISRLFNYNYQAIEGDGLDGNGEFFISEDVFQKCVDNILKD